MELQEDCYRLQQVLINADPREIIRFLRTKVSLADTERRCQLALQHFLNLEDDLAKKGETYEDDLKADFLCIRHLLNSVPDEEIQQLLRILGTIPNRKQVAVKLLLEESSQPSRKKRKNDNSHTHGENCEASNSKLIKIADSDEQLQSNNNGNENLKTTEGLAEQRGPLKLTIKNVKDRNCNDKFMIMSTTNTRSEQGSTKNYPTEHVSVIGSTQVPIIDLSNQENSPNVFQYSAVNEILNTARIEGSTDSSNELPSSSNNYQNKAGRVQNKSPQSPNLDGEPNESSTKDPSNEVPSSSNNYQNQPKLVHSKSAPSIDELYQQTTVLPFTSQLKVWDLTSVAHLHESNEVQLLNGNLVNPDQNAENNVPISEGPRVIDEKLVLKLIELFPEASSDYIRNVCDGKEWSEQNFDEIITVILSTEEYPRRPERQQSPAKEVDPEEQLNMLKEVLPDADPSYLHEKLDQLAGDQDGLRHFIEDAMENKRYPTLKEYLRKQQLSAQQRQYTTEFNVERFVELFPDPVSIFEDPDRKTTILDQSDKSYVKWFMRNKFNQLYAKDINVIVESEGGKNIVSIVKALNECVAKGCLKKSRWISHIRPDTRNIPLLQELAYFEHIDQIYIHVENKKRLAEQARQNAKELGLLQSCSCCYDDEVMPDDILTCTGGCRFCRDCIKRSTEVAFGEGKVVFSCLMTCGAEFNLQVLQNVLPPKVFSKLAQKKAVAEVQAAGVEDLETCPFCDFATIPAPEDKLFRCLNQDCMKESCRLCKEPSHVPLRCDEVEKDEDVKARTYIEDKMTEALIRQCWKCDAKFIKEEGCNKMTCSCGAIMCYVCRKPVKDYKHFNGQGGDKYNLCPLYTDNFLVNENNVLKAAENAKKEVDPTQLKNDPTADLQKHFGSKIKEAEQRALQRHDRAHMHGLPNERFQEVQRLRNELREQLRTIRDLNRHDHRHIGAFVPHNHPVIAAYGQQQQHPHPPGQQPRPPGQHPRPPGQQPRPPGQHPRPPGQRPNQQAVVRIDVNQPVRAVRDLNRNLGLILAQPAYEQRPQRAPLPAHVPPQYPDIQPIEDANINGYARGQ